MMLGRFRRDHRDIMVETTFAADRSVLESALQTIERYSLFGPGDTIVVGVSGGPDSLCLLHVLCSLQHDRAIRLHVAHLDHGIRGSEARADALMVQELASEWGLPCTVERVDVPALAAKPGISVEEASRQCRYAFLARVARRLGAGVIAVGHNADDQAETVLMHWLRGAGLAGLRGMLPSTPLTTLRLSLLPVEERPAMSGLRLIRPLLQVTRAHIEAYCRAHGLHPREDLSNLDTTYFRNRLRHDLLPCLETYNPQIRDVLCRSAAAIADDHALLRTALEESWPRIVVSESETAVQFDLQAWRALPRSLQRATLREAVHRLRLSLRNINFEHIENAMWLAVEKPTGAQATLPQGLLLTVGYDRLTLADDAAGPPGSSLPQLSATGLHVPVPGALTIPRSRWVVETALLAREELPRDWQSGVDRWAVFLDADVSGTELRLRCRQRGDRFQPLGMGGSTVKLSEFMINAKIEQRLRDHWPLLSGQPGILWVIGCRQEERTRVTASTQRVLRVRLHQTETAELAQEAGDGLSGSVPSEGPEG
jgi:tRNA(Ile)-lysidine synthase